jgi:hypothetical protein
VLVQVANMDESMFAHNVFSKASVHFWLLFLSQSRTSSLITHPNLLQLHPPHTRLPSRRPNLPSTHPPGAPRAE